MHRFLFVSICFTVLYLGTATTSAIDVVGLSVTPRVQSANMRWRRPADKDLGARVEFEQAIDFDPAGDASDLEVLRALGSGGGK